MNRRGDGGNVGRAGYCDVCKEWMPAGPDACLGWIPGVSHACCGHGKLEMAYVVIGGDPDEGAWKTWNVVLRGADAMTFFDLVKRGEHCLPDRRAKNWHRFTESDTIESCPTETDESVIETAI